MQNKFVEIRKIARELPHSPGVYLMKDQLGSVIYVGKAKDLRKRVGSYFQGSRKFVWSQPKIGAMVEMVREISHVVTKSETEALLLEGKLIKEYKPRYNTDFTDDKQFLLVRVDLQNELPKFRLCRNKREDGAHYYGPFAQSGMLRSTLSEMRKKFGILLSDAKPVKLESGKYKLYDDARAEIFSGHNETTVVEYADRVRKACEFLEGRVKDWLKELRDEMEKRASAMDFEKAAELRDLIEALARTIGRKRKFERNWSQINIDKVDALGKLGKALGLNHNPNTIECFDISHVSGTFVVASMVRFVTGKPDKRSYRRFKIRSFDGNDDFKAMEEVITRRYGRLLREKLKFPDLVVVDGGLGQVSSAMNAFESLKCAPPSLIGLAKKEETIVFPDERGELNLDSREPALRLLQRIRDEAHRFANQFNADLRSRKIRESILDDFSGLGAVRRKALLEHFGSIDKLKNATLEDLREVDGIGPKIAEQINLFLKNTQR
ncbi:MAG: excinuclease ABC subunit UvrC [Verrucomicrobiota bacterium]|nr:excinuclease ABC subunit UvrC [Verrucomicrobiota bacterium]